MKDKLRLLIVEDEDVLINQWKRNIEMYNVEDDSDFDLIAIYATSLDEVKDALFTNRVDAAIIDLRLNNAKAHQNSDGNEVYKLIKDTSLTLMAICTGEPNLFTVDNEVKPFVEVFVKEGEVTNLIFKWLSKNKMLLSSIRNTGTKIEKEMSTLFSKSIWPRWSIWVNDQENKEHTDNALIRHMATHLHATFLDLGSQKVHPEEYYFIPPLKSNLDTGDIFNIDGCLEILVTPRCDLAQKPKYQNYHLVKLSDVSDEWNKRMNKINLAPDAGKKKEATENLRRLSNHNGNSNFCHFLPQIKISDDDIKGPFHAQFDSIRAISVTEFEILKKARIGSLSNEFVPSLVERLGSFFSRIGTPDYSHPN